MPPKTSPKNLMWWKETDQQAVARALFDMILHIEDDQQERREKNLRCLRLYGNYDYQGLGPYAYSRPQTPQLPENRVKMNVICSSADTVCSKVSKMRPRPSFLTDGGNWGAQEKAKKLTKFVNGLFKRNHIYAKHREMFRDSTIMDIGAVKHFRQGDRICSERVMPNEIFVEAADAMYGSPYRLYHVKYVAKETLFAAFKAKKAMILESSSSMDSNKNWGSLSEEEKDYVIVVEAWSLPTGDKSDGTFKAGRHLLAVDKGILWEKEKGYEREYFPFTFERWSNPMVGFYGQSLADRLTGNQIEINKMLRMIQKSFHLGSGFKVFLEYGSKISKDHINNEIGSLIYYNGQPPTFTVPQTVHPEFFNHLQWLIRSSYEEAGISQLSATSRIPTGLDTGSGKALREYNDIESERFVLTAQDYEETFLETARQYIDLAREMAEEGVDLEVTGESKRFLQTIKWSEIALEGNEFLMQVFPVSSLPKDPAGRLAYVQELINGGLMDPEFALSLLEFPDTDAYASLKTAKLDDIMSTLDQLLYKGHYLTPEPFQDLKMGIEIMQMAYLRAKKEGAPDARLDLVRRWITEAQARLDMAAAASNANPNAPTPPTGSEPLSPMASNPAGVAVPQMPTTPQTGAPAVMGPQGPLPAIA